MYFYSFVTQKKDVGDRREWCVVDTFSCHSHSLFGLRSDLLWLGAAMRVAAVRRKFQSARF